MTDFFDRLEMELLDAVRRSAAPTTVVQDRGRSRAPRPRYRRPLLVALLGIMLTGTAAAAVMKLNGEASHPPTGSLHSAPVPGPAPDNGPFARFCAANPGSCPGSKGSKVDYSLSIVPFVGSTPSTEAGVGSVAWCARLALKTGGGDGVIQGCSPAQPASSSARVVGLGAGVGADRMTFVVVDQRVASVHLRSERIIQARRFPGWPTAWKLAIWRGGHDTPSTVQLLDAEGRRLPNRGSLSAPPLRVQSATHDIATGYRRCTISSTRPSVGVSSVRVLADAPRASAALSGKPMLTCASARIDRRYDAYVLLDAGAPGTRDPVSLPGAVRSKMDPSVVHVGATLSARRIGAAWLVVEASTPSRRRRDDEHRDLALAALAIGSGG